MFKKVLEVCGRVLALCSLAFAIISANSVCGFIYHQSKTPDEIKKLRKF